jgi:hypothetical protein
MTDILFLSLVFGFFILMGGLIWLCDRLMER